MIPSLCNFFLLFKKKKTIFTSIKKFERKKCKIQRDEETEKKTENFLRQRAELRGGSGGGGGEGEERG